MTEKTIAIIGAGLQGSCAAIALARLGWRVVVFEANHAPMLEASRWNEGKLHLGYVYANDASLRTTGAMIEGSLSFAPILRDLLEIDLSAMPVSAPFKYAILQDTMVPESTLAAHFAAVDQRLRAWADWSYPGAHFRPTVKVATDEEYGDKVCAAFQTSEIAVDPHWVAECVGRRLLDDPMIEVRLNDEVTDVTSETGGVTLTLQSGERLAFAHCINASWRSLLKFNDQFAPPGQEWLYRYKAAIHLSGAASNVAVASTTFVLGPYGDIVNFGDGRAYLSWYPICRLAVSQDAAPPHPRDVLAANSLDAVTDGSIAALTELVPALNSWIKDAVRTTDGGWIFAWAKTDIDHINSRLHARHDVGLMSYGAYHVLNTGKYCMAPLHAARLAELFGRSA